MRLSYRSESSDTLVSWSSDPNSRNFSTFLEEFENYRPLLSCNMDLVVVGVLRIFRQVLKGSKAFWILVSKTFWIYSFHEFTAYREYLLSKHYYLTREHSYLSINNMNIKIILLFIPTLSYTILENVLS